VHAEDVERLERLVVHVEEAVRLGAMADEAHLRLGLMLLDSAAELLMHRVCEPRLDHAEAEREILRGFEAMYEATGRGTETIAELRGKVIPGSRRRRIERDFGAKCDYLHEQGLLAGPQARVLKKLHKYRNETYHRDQLRPETLASAAKVYIYLVCSMMRDFPVQMMCYGAELPAGLLRYLASDERGIRLVLDVGPGLQARIAARLLDESGVDHPARLGEALSQHVRDRLGDLERAAWEPASFLARPGDDCWDLEAILGLVQIDSGDLGRVRSSDDARSLAVPVRVVQIRQWRAAGEALAVQADDLAAFAAFADLEDAFEPVEALVMKLAMDVDREIQLQTDFARGK
jgi:hypothetical protein